MFVIIFFFNLRLFSQTIFFQNIYKGGVCFAGFSTGLTYGNGSFETFVEPGSIIKNVFLLYNIHGEPTQQYNINLDGINVSLTNETYNNNRYKETQYTNLYEYGIGIKDITSIYQNVTMHNIQIPNQSNLNCGLNCAYRNFSIIIIYENISLSTISFSLLLNNQDLNIYENNYQNNLNAINLNSPFAFSLNTDIIGSPLFNDGTFVIVENQNIGLVGGADNVNSTFTYGTRGHFYYQNNQLFGLDDDTPNSIMNNSDALADVSSYISGSTLQWKLKWQNTNVHENIYTSFHLAYSTPCQPFNVSVSNDTVVCPGEAVQLHASGGVQYEWLPHKNLSCYNCANPVFTGDSSQFYSVRIWNNDSCSVVRPVMVRVRPKPTFSNLSSSPSVCGGSTGSIVGISPNASHYSLDNTAWQTSGSFSNLQAGNYTVYVTDTNGCVGDSTLSVTEQTTVHAQFTATPSTGTVPLSVVLNNQSTNYTHLEWFVDGVSQGANFSQFLAGQSGVYEIELVAWQNNSTCADTFSLQISAYDSLLISIPNIVTPNQDGINDQFSIQCNQPINITYSILNRWGNVLSAGTRNKQQGNVVLWNIPNEITDGVYFYKITFSSENPQIQQQLEQLGAVKNGFVEVVR